MPLLDIVAAAVRRERLIPDGAAVLIALSGGADSMALLHAMRALAPAHGWRLAAAHVNHGLRGDEAERDEAFAREWCARWSVPLHVMRAMIFRLRVMSDTSCTRLSVFLADCISWR